MQRDYQKWFSPSLGRDMELLIFGHSGTPVLVFPASGGRFYDYEDRGMIAAVAGKYESGQLQAFCVDSVDAESWYNKAIPPGDRLRRHRQYERYLLDEVRALIRFRNDSPQLVAHGCSFGGYHAVNLTLRHPGVITGCISFGGSFDVRHLLNGFYDDDCYFNSPPDFLPRLTDPELLARCRALSPFILATGELDLSLQENHRLSRILAEKQIPHCLDVWGNGAGHDWHWWRQMVMKFLG